MLTQRRTTPQGASGNHPQPSHAPGELYIGTYDFETQEPDQFSFRQNEIITIVHKENSGWWAALIEGKIGWVPAAYLEPWNEGRSPRAASSLDDDGYLSPDAASDLYDPTHRLSQDTDGPVTPIPSLSPTDPLVDDLTSNFASTTLRTNKSHVPGSRTSGAPIPPTYSMSLTSNGSASTKYGYSQDPPTFYGISPSYDPPIPHQLSLVMEEGSDVNSQWSMPHDKMSRHSINSSYGKLSSPTASTASSAISAAALRKARLSQASIPWYLRPRYAWEELKLDPEGIVVAGTVQALIERLLLDDLKPAQELAYRTTFLNTFKCFTTAEHLLDTLLIYYGMEPPESLGPAESLEWKEKKLRPTQTRILGVLSLWAEKHGIMQDDPQLINRLRSFLASIHIPTGLALGAKQLLQSMDRMDDDLLSLHSNPSSSPASSFSIRRKPKAPKGEFLKWDTGDVANHLTLMESRAYNKIRPHECLSWTRSTKGPAVVYLTNFISMSDRLAAWVKLSILTCESLGKRADMIDHWIRIAERCRALNNIFSTSAIVAALSGGDVGKLHLTWAHINRAATLEQLVRITDPIGGFSNYKNLHNSLSNETPCVPFISVFLTDLVHINDQYPNTVPTPAGPEPDLVPPRPLVNFIKLQRFSDVVSSILKFNGRTYKGITENTSMTQTIEQQIEAAATKDAGFFWQRSQELQSAEVTHADIWKNLNDAGF